MKSIYRLLLVFNLFFSCSKDDNNDTNDQKKNTECSEVILETSNALSKFNEVDTEDIKLSNEKCLEYKTLLIRQKNICGDPDNVLQQAINDLNCDKVDIVFNCEVTSQKINELTKIFEETLIDIDESPENVCVELKELLKSQIENCGDDSGNLQIKLDQLADCSFQDNNIKGFITLKGEHLNIVRVEGTNNTKTNRSQIDIVLNQITFDKSTNLFVATNYSNNDYRIIFKHERNAIGDDWLRSFGLYINDEFHYAKGLNDGSIQSNTSQNNSKELDYTFKVEVSKQNFKSIVRAKGKAQIRFK